MDESTAHQRTCAQCDGSMEHRKQPWAKFCSDRCQRRARQEEHRVAVAAVMKERRCRQCGGSMESKDSRALNCSKLCAKRYRYSVSQKVRAGKLVGREPCLTCGGAIPDDKQTNARYCSGGCVKAGVRSRYVTEGRSKQARRRYLYGITEEQFQALLEAQDGRCAICKTSEWGGRHNVPHIDHDHACCTYAQKTCGKCIRGLLCNRCNAGLGWYDDNVELFEAAAAYLRRSTAQARQEEAA